MTIFAMKKPFSPLNKASKLPLMVSMAAALAVSACQSAIPNRPPIPHMLHSNEVISQKNDSTIGGISPTATLSKQQQITQQANDIKQALVNKNYQAIAPNIHPTKGVRFSMYAYIRPESDKVFSRQQFTQYLNQSRIKFTWGAKDGTGDLYITPLPDYLQHWVASGLSKADSDSVSYNQFQGRGNSLNNLKERYPNGDFVEFYFAGTDQYSGIDWRSMRLVFEAYQGQYYLVAIVNDQWTT